MKYLISICVALMLLLIGCDNKTEIKTQSGDELIGTWELTPPTSDNIRFTISREQDKLVSKVSSTELAIYENKKLVAEGFAFVGGKLSYDDQADTLYDLILDSKFVRVGVKPKPINTNKELAGEDIIGLWTLMHDGIPLNHIILKVDKEGDKFRLTTSLSNKLQYENGIIRVIDFDGTLGPPMIYNKETDTITGEDEQFNMKLTFRRVTN